MDSSEKLALAIKASRRERSGVNDIVSDIKCTTLDCDWPSLIQPLPTLMTKLAMKLPDSFAMKSVPNRRHLNGPTVRFNAEECFHNGLRTFMIADKHMGGVKGVTDGNQSQIRRILTLLNEGAPVEAIRDSIEGLKESDASMHVLTIDEELGKWLNCTAELHNALASPIDDLPQIHEATIGSFDAAKIASDAFTTSETGLLDFFISSLNQHITAYTDKIKGKSARYTDSYIVKDMSYFDQDYFPKDYQVAGSDDYKQIVANKDHLRAVELYATARSLPGLSPQGMPLQEQKPNVQTTSINLAIADSAFNMYKSLRRPEVQLPPATEDPIATLAATVRLIANFRRSLMELYAYIKGTTAILNIIEETFSIKQLSHPHGDFLQTLRFHAAIVVHARQSVVADLSSAYAELSPQCIMPGTRMLEEAVRYGRPDQVQRFAADASERIQQKAEQRREKREADMDRKIQALQDYTRYLRPAADVQEAIRCGVDAAQQVVEGRLTQ